MYVCHPTTDSTAILHRLGVVVFRFPTVRLTNTSLHVVGLFRNAERTVVFENKRDTERKYREIVCVIKLLLHVRGV